MVVVFLAILKGHAGMADSEGCKRNPLARDIFRPMVANLQNLSEIEKIVCLYRFSPLRHALLIISIQAIMHRGHFCF